MNSALHGSVLGENSRSHNSNIRERLSPEMEMLPKEEYEGHGRRWAIRSNRAATHRLHISTKDLLQFQPLLVKGQRLSSLVEA